MSLAQIGPLTDLAEALATAVGAAMLLGAFTAGALGVIRGDPRPALEENALSAGYVGGIVGASIVILDLVFRYVV